MSPGPLPALPVDVLGCIARATFAVEDSTVQSRQRLSLVCRTWRDCLRGVPLHVDVQQEPMPDRLRTVLSGSRYASVDLHDSLTQMHPVPLAVPSLIVAALAGSAATLTALHGLPLVEAAEHPETGLANFTRLRALTLRPTSECLENLRAIHLPASLEDLTLVLDLSDFTDGLHMDPPRLLAFRQAAQPAADDD